jgi:predicted  nucleic acid-binding Zn-ribbon protein
VTNGLEKFTELENKIYRVIELFKAVKLQKESLEKDVLRTKAQLEQMTSDNDRMKLEIQDFKKEKQLVKEKVEGILDNLEKLSL